MRRSCLLFSQVHLKKAIQPPPGLSRHIGHDHIFNGLDSQVKEVFIKFQREAKKRIESYLHQDKLCVKYENLEKEKSLLKAKDHEVFREHPALHDQGLPRMLLGRLRRPNLAALEAKAKARANPEKARRAKVQAEEKAEGNLGLRHSPRLQHHDRLPALALSERDQVSKRKQRDG